MKTLVIEDSRLARDGLVKMLAGFAELEIVGSARDVGQARTIIAEHRPELLFLDIHMPGETGFDLLESLDYTPKIIFTTAYSEHAIRSFDHHTIDYLLKPVSQERLAMAIRKLTSGQNNERSMADSRIYESPLDMHNKIFIKDGNNCHLIEVRSIDYCESCKNYVMIFFDGKKAFIKRSLNQVEQRLPAGAFFRASRQYIVNLQSIVQISESVGEGYEVIMKDGKLIEISRRNAIRMKELLSL